MVSETVVSMPQIRRVLSKGKILLKLISGKTLALNNFLHDPALNRNLISGGLVNKACIKLVFKTSILSDV